MLKRNCPPIMLKVRSRSQNSWRKVRDKVVRLPIQSQGGKGAMSAITNTKIIPWPSCNIADITVEFRMLTGLVWKEELEAVFLIKQNRVGNHASNGWMIKLMILEPLRALKALKLMKIMEHFLCFYNNTIPPQIMIM